MTACTCLEVGVFLPDAFLTVFADAFLVVQGEGVAGSQRARSGGRGIGSRGHSTLRMKLQPGFCPFPALAFWGKNPPWHIAGIYRPLPVSKVLSKEQRNTGCISILSVGS